MASASPTCLPCNALYEPNPDIAGQAIFLAFLAHTCTFIFLAMIVTPIISFYLPPVPTRIASGPDVIPMQVEELQIQEASGFRRPERDITVASGPNVIPMQVEELQIQEASGFRRPERDITVEELQIQEASGFRRPERDITVEELQIQEASGFRLPERDTTPRYLYRCYCQQTIESTYTSQYISGVAFIVTAFVKWREISPYHLRVIYSIVSMHTIIGLVANYGRQSLLSLSFARLCLGADRAPSWDRLVYKALDSAVLLNLLLLSIFTVLVPVYSYRDQCFQSCYDKNTWTYAVSVVFFYYLLIFSIQQNGDNGPLGWTIFTSFITLFIVFQVWQFRELTRIFRPVALPLGISSELTFSFGQILVLFMIFPLVTEFLGALYGTKTKCLDLLIKYSILIGDSGLKTNSATCRTGCSCQDSVYQLVQNPIAVVLQQACHCHSYRT
ncbi:hypothetical protein BKA61DRAFT_152162 [Leptodontidium sp. MPI-SDFR-AT-0119]|nr:hypothetical protein BKA61DRAFT_152162 [Leptodontidium sp. MPI-SDFR-AT-0119]